MNRLFFLLLFIFVLMSSCKKDPFWSRDVKDYDGNVYTTVRLGDQEWMAENLRATHFSNGDPVSRIVSDKEWITLEEAAYARFRESDSLVEIYGLHYNWYAATDTRGICPDGWHVPSFDDWKELRTFLGGKSLAGGKLKEVGTEHWENNVDASDSSGMTMLPGGYRSHSNGWCNSLGIIGFWWSTTEIDSIEAFSMVIRYYDAILYTRDIHKRTGASIRCVKD